MQPRRPALPRPSASTTTSPSTASTSTASPSTASPSTNDVLAFFGRYRQTASAACSFVPQPPASEDTELMTQVNNSDAGWRQRQYAIGDTQPLIPFDRTKGTDSFRLQAIRRSPRNLSPALERGRPAVCHLPTKKSQAPITLVLDVDETLVHSSYDRSPGETYDLDMCVTYNGNNTPIYVKYRPHLNTFLDFVHDKFEVVIFTASVSAYCNPLMDLVDPDGKLGNLRLFRDHCTQCKKSYVKDLFCLGRPLERIVIIDNSPNAYLFQQRNALPISSWFDDRQDVELLNLMPVLSHLSRCESVYDTLDIYNATGRLPDSLPANASNVHL